MTVNVCGKAREYTVYAESNGVKLVYNARNGLALYYNGKMRSVVKKDDGFYLPGASYEASGDGIRDGINIRREPDVWIGHGTAEEMLSKLDTESIFKEAI
jgi:hypothetical protein